MPPKSREHEFRRARLAQWVETNVESWLTADAWDACAEARQVPDGADVVLALDGSFSQDSTALVAATVSPRPHPTVVGLWERPDRDPAWRVDVLAVDAAVRRDAARRWQVREVIADPFRWQRSLAVLAEDGLPVVEFPQTAQRKSPATTGLTEAAANRRVTHDGDKRLRAHVLKAVLRDDRRGVRDQVSKHSEQRIDLAVCCVMAHARAAWHARQAPVRRKRVVAW